MSRDPFLVVETLRENVVISYSQKAMCHQDQILKIESCMKLNDLHAKLNLRRSPWRQGEKCTKLFLPIWRFGRWSTQQLTAKSVESKDWRLSTRTTFETLGFGLFHSRFRWMNLKTVSLISRSLWKYWPSYLWFATFCSSSRCFSMLFQCSTKRNLYFSIFTK